MARWGDKRIGYPRQVVDTQIRDEDSDEDEVMPLFGRQASIACRAVSRMSQRREARGRKWRPAIESLETRSLLTTGPVLAGITPNDGSLLLSNDVRHEAPQELTFRFDQDQVINPDTLATGIKIIRAGGDDTFDNGNDVAITPGYVGIGRQSNEVVYRFAETLPDDRYRITIDGTGDDALKNAAGQPFNGGQDMRREFSLDLGARVVAVVPQPISRQSGTNNRLVQNRNQIVVYFNDDDLSVASASNPNFYQLTFTGHANSFAANVDTVNNLDDGATITPTSVEYNPQTDTAVLTFAGNDLASLGVGTYRLRIGTTEPIASPPTNTAVLSDPGSSFASAMVVTGNVTAQGVILSEAINNNVYPLQLPGSNNDPGHRDAPTARDLHVPANAQDRVNGISTISYNFRSNYGEDQQGNPLVNAISERQKQRAREVFELYGHYLGTQFVETASDGFTIVTGDVRAVDPNVTNDPAILTGLAGDIDDFGLTAIANANVSWDDGYGESWFREIMRQVGVLLGMGLALDLPEGTIMGGDPRLTFGLPAEPVFPGAQDIVHGQRLFRPDATDIDLYRFDVANDGLFTAEVTAERLQNPSHLDSFLRLYRQTDQGPVLIAQNDDYFSQDSFLELNLTAGTYFIGVTSRGNESYDPSLADTGFGGTTQGAYSIRLHHRPTLQQGLTDSTGTLLDGDDNGVPGGAYNFWFRNQSLSDTLFVDKLGLPDGSGSIDNPFNNLQSAIAAASPGDIIRVVGNRIVDGTRVREIPYEIGFDPLGERLVDSGADGLLQVPRGVTMMFDAGAIFKLRRGAIVVSSSSPSFDRSGGSLQVLGTPQQPVYFTSYNDATIGNDVNPLDTPPSRGDWGGIVFRGDVDNAEGRFRYEDQGIFLDYVNHADMRYGGGIVFVDSITQVVNPITMIDARPTITYNSITTSADAAMAASPNAFEETTFHEPENQTVRFTSNFTRIGPSIRGNRIVDNTTNALAIFNPASAANDFQELTVSARWDDTDIVHVVSQNIAIQGTPGGQRLNPLSGLPESRLDARLRIDPGTIVKLEGASIEVEIGATFLAEGTAVKRVVFTSLLDDRFGAGSSFDTNGDRAQAAEPTAGDWGGIYVGPTAIGSIDQSIFAYGGGTQPSGGGFVANNVLEFHQAIARVTNSQFEHNANGTGGLAPANRFGQGFNEPATIFVRGTQPIIVNNQFLNNAAAVVSIDANSLTAVGKVDSGRNTGEIGRIPGYLDNNGPLIRGNRLTNNGLNGLEVRGGTLSTASVWDDVDIVHVLRDGIYVPNFHTYGGLRLQSSPEQSLVIKLAGEEAGFVTTGTALGIDDHIGGSLYVVGSPGHPVVMTSLFDDSVGAGLDHTGRTQTDTNNGGRPLRSHALNTSNTFQIDLNFGPNISLNQDFVNAVRKAADAWELEFEDPIRVTIDVEIANLGAVGRNGQNLVQTVVDTSDFEYSSVRERMINDARDHESIVAQLPEFQDFSTNVLLPVDITNAYSVSQSMRLTRANAKALGLADSGLSGTPSAYDATELRDGSLTIHSDLTAWDFDRKNALLTYREDFNTYIMREMGEILGFRTAVDDVNAALNGAANRTITPTPLDLFRLEPGTGGGDFANAPRVLDPRIPDHVFYAGGDFDPTGWAIPGLHQGDVPLSTGRDRFSEFNDVFGAGHWRDEVFYRNEKLTVTSPIGIMDPVSQLRDEIAWRNDPFQTTEGLMINVSEPDRLAFDVIGYDVVGGSPGDWRGIDLEQMTNSRNVALVLEQESSSGAAPGPNATPSTAQFLGVLAADEKGGDQTTRLGFEIHGVVSAPRDVDVYSFTGTAGTEVWLDIDKTTVGLDTVIELVNAAGTVLARSDNSHNEAETGADLFGIGQTIGTSDLYTTNIYDAGMRVVLPGLAGSSSVTYYVRVRSGSADLSNVAGGTTSGQYQLQIRLQSEDEVPGTAINYSDVRFADTGINIVGPPIRSPLIGEHVEDESFNDGYREFDVAARNPDGTPTTTIFPNTTLPYDVRAQKLGNLLTSDLGAFSVFGTLSGADDVDWFEFRLGYDRLLPTQAPTGFTDPTAAPVDPALSAGVVFDIDYADGLARPNTALSVFDEFGTLIYYSATSNIPADQHGPGNGAQDLSRGSFGSNDPFIGPVSLEASNEPRDSTFFNFGGFGFPGFGVGSGTYFVAVTPIGLIPAQISLPGVTQNPVLGDPNRGFEVVQPPDPFPTFITDTQFVLNPAAPPDAAVSGEYQLEIRYVKTPTGGFGPGNVGDGDSNRERSQGQISISGNSVSDSRNFGIHVQPAHRDLPFYIGDVFTGSSGLEEIVTFNDQLDPRSRPHANFTTADYAPRMAPARGLTSLNEERLVPGLTISNNVISGGVEGGIHLQGDPGGIILRTFDLDRIVNLQPNTSVQIERSEFTLWDHQRNFQTFEFDSDGNVRQGSIPIRYDTNPLNDCVFFADRWQQATPPTMASCVIYELEHAIRSSSLDVTVQRGDENSILVLGAIEVGHPDVLPGGFRSVFNPDGSVVPLITATIAQQGAVPFIHVVNNTVVGRGGTLLDTVEDPGTPNVPADDTVIEGTGISDVGILVEDNSSPTLLNNIVANFATGIRADLTSTDQPIGRRTFVGGSVSIPQLAFDPLSVGLTIFNGGYGTEGAFLFTPDGLSPETMRDIDSSATEYVATRATVLGGNLYQTNQRNVDRITQGDFPISLTKTSPLFVSPETGNFRLKTGSRAIDSSVNALQERDGLAAVLQSIGQLASRLLAPTNDAQGLLRVDDPSVEPPSGLGQNVFKDRGALERADFAGPIARLIEPADNDSAGNDLNVANSEVFILGTPLDAFVIQLVDGVTPADPAFGSGPDPNTINANQVTLLEGTRLLTRGIDYLYSFDATSNTIRLSPLVGDWPDNRNYTIRLDNSSSAGMKDKSGNVLQPNRLTNVTQFDIALGQGFDFGDAPDPTFPTMLASNGARHVFDPNIYLGMGVGVEIDGTSSVTASTDELDDGIIFNSPFIPGAAFQFTASASTAGVLNAWVDLNGNGSWNDFGERIVFDVPLTAGDNVVRLATTPLADVLMNQSQAAVFMRFRFSTVSVGSPTGEAPNGEVEDYQVVLRKSPWQNPTMREDVNNNACIQPLDALAIINELTNRVLSDPNTGTLPIPAVPPNTPDGGVGTSQFIDVNGDGFLSPVDAVIVINALGTRPCPETPAAASLPQAAAHDAALGAMDDWLNARSEQSEKTEQFNQAHETTNTENQSQSQSQPRNNVRHSIGARLGVRSEFANTMLRRSGKSDGNSWDTILAVLANDLTRVVDAERTR